MKILIITFTGGVNPGTFMQALGVQTALRKIYPEADIEYLKFPDFKKGKLMGQGKNASIWHIFLQKGYAAYRLLKYNRLRKHHFNYTQSIDLFNYPDTATEWLKQYDLVVIGSDTILEQAYNERGKIGLNWMPFDVTKVYFAASASPANFMAHKDLKGIVENANFIGLRDDLSIRFFEEKLGVSSEYLVKQPDPSYFLDISKYKLSNRLRLKLKPREKYVLYNFNSGFTYRKVLADSLRVLGYKVISTAYNPYADICFDTIDAYEWAGVFPLIDLVVTERFHDSVFALRNCKPIIAIDWEKNRFGSEGDSKTYRILEDYGHEHLHFNLYNRDNIDSIIDTIRNISELYDKLKIQKVNVNLIEMNNNILKLLDSIIK